MKEGGGERPRIFYDRIDYGIIRPLLRLKMLSKSAPLARLGTPNEIAKAMACWLYEQHIEMLPN